MVVGAFRGLAATAGSFEKAGLDQIGLMDIFECALIFLDRSSQGFHPDRSSSKLVNDGEKNLTIHLIEPPRINAQPCQCVLGYSLGNSSRRLDLGIVAYPLDKPVHDPWGSASATGNLLRSLGIDRDPEDSSRPCHNRLQLHRRIKVQAVNKPKSVTKGRGQGTGPRGGPDERKSGEI